jgi:hypothetical protein
MGSFERSAYISIALCHIEMAEKHQRCEIFVEKSMESNYRPRNKNKQSGYFFSDGIVKLMKNALSFAVLYPLQAGALANGHDNYNKKLKLNIQL